MDRFEDYAFFNRVLQARNFLSAMWTAKFLFFARIPISNAWNDLKECLKLTK